MVAETLWRDPALGREITRSPRPSAQTLEILKATTWGSRATQYRILGLEAKLARLRDPSFFALSENGRELCVFVLDHCSKTIAGTLCDGYHFVMAATRPTRRGEGLAGLLIDHIRPYCEAIIAKPGFGFAYVEETTVYSLRLSERTGHSIEADIPLTLFTRLFPRDNARAGPLRGAERPQVLGALKALYKDHELTDFETSVIPDECFVFRRDGAVTAAVQAEVLNWSVTSLPGPAGAFLLKVLPRLPGLNALLDLRDLRILRLGNPLFRQGAEGDFFALAEACLRRHDARIGLIMLDARSPVLAGLRRHGRFGLLSRALTGSAKLHIDTVQMPDAMVARLGRAPLLVSPADVF